MRRIGVLVGLGVVAGALFAAPAVVAAGASSTPAGGSVIVSVQPGDSNVDSLLITGAIGDYGTVRSIDKSGKTDPNGDYRLITLQKGTFEAAATELTSKEHSATFPINKSSCSSGGSLSAPLTLTDGTGLYKAIGGTVTITETYGWVLTRYTSGKDTGQCDSHDVAKMTVTITGAGDVTF